MTWVKQNETQVYIGDKEGYEEYIGYKLPEYFKGGFHCFIHYKIRCFSENGSKYFMSGCASTWGNGKAGDCMAEQIWAEEQGLV